MHTTALTLSRLHLTPFNLDMVSDRYVSWLLDPEVVKYSEQRHRHHSVESCRAFVASIDHVHAHMWAIFHGDSHVGNITAHRDTPNGTADVGILMGDRSVWGQGFGAETYGAVTEWLLASGCRMVTGGTMEANKGMTRVFEKCGFSIDGVRPGFFMLDGTPTGMVLASKA
jgi:RimJ/RimL family protein N-acetyltransferase